MRLRPRFVVLSERPDRPTAVLAEVEQQQLEICRSFQPGDVGAAPRYLCVAKNSTGGVAQVLVHVSTYQGSILAPVF